MVPIVVPPQIVIVPGFARVKSLRMPMPPVFDIMIVPPELLVKVPPK